MHCRLSECGKVLLSSSSLLKSVIFAERFQGCSKRRGAFVYIEQTNVVTADRRDVLNSHGHVFLGQIVDPGIKK